MTGAKSSVDIVTRHQVYNCGQCRIGNIFQEFGISWWLPLVEFIFQSVSAVLHCAAVTSVGAHLPLSFRPMTTSFTRGLPSRVICFLATWFPSASCFSLRAPIQAPMTPFPDPTKHAMGTSRMNDAMFLLRITWPWSEWTSRSLNAAYIILLSVLDPSIWSLGFIKWGEVNKVEDLTQIDTKAFLACSHKHSTGSRTCDSLSAALQPKFHYTWESLYHIRTA